MTRNVLAVGLLCAACCAAGYVRGFGIAETRGRALLAEQAEASASEREALAVAAAAIGADGLIIEVHNDPPHALCDGAQSITPAQFDTLMGRLTALAPCVGREL